MRDIVTSALRASLVTWLLCGLAYPLALTGLGQWLMPFQANGSLERNPDGAVIGSRLIGQAWNGPQWFHGRPSATTDTDPNDPTKTVPAPYNAASSGASNLGPTSKDLAKRLSADRKALEEMQPELVGATAAGRHADDVGLGSRSGHQPGQRGAAGRSGGTSARSAGGGNRRLAGSSTSLAAASGSSASRA